MFKSIERLAIRVIPGRSPDGAEGKGIQEHRRAWVWIPFPSAEFIVGPAKGRTRWLRPGMTDGQRR